MAGSSPSPSRCSGRWTSPAWLASAAARLLSLLAIAWLATCVAVAVAAADPQPGREQPAGPSQPLPPPVQLGPEPDGDVGAAAARRPRLCGTSSAFRNSNVLLVATLDGAITALDPSEEGNTIWQVQTAPGDLLSSTIHSLELTNQAHLVRLIPSLGGGLYKFDGQTVEPVPLNAETLLRASFKFADSTIITGGKETRTYGIELDSGSIRYECGLSGCENSRSDTDTLDDILVVQRETQVVRAVEPRNGQEKWNFSVSQHTVDLQTGMDDPCGDDNEDSDADDEEELEESEIKAVVSDGVICSVQRQQPDLVKWSHKFDSPIVHAWRIYKGKLTKVDLFSSSTLPPRQSESGEINIQTPLLYIGTHKHQLYIQESDRLFDENAEMTHKLLLNPQGDESYPKVTWRPYLISSHSRTPVINHGSKVGKDSAFPLLSYDEKAAENTALAVFTGSEYPYDSGLYLFPDEADLEYDPLLDYDDQTIKPATSESPVTGSTILGPVIGGDTNQEQIENYTIQVVFVSLWYWWKEVMLISFLTALFMNVLITRPLIKGLKEQFRRRLEHITADKTKTSVVVVEVPVPVPTSKPDPGTASSGVGSAGSLNTEFSWQSSLDSNSEFSSRYLTDYEPVQCLGKGGFGVVFEAKNRIDDIHYAVKRIRLPKLEEARKKVMREVKFLAKLDHKNIVRYFNTWLERPPPGWQETQDKWWRDALAKSGGHSLNQSSVTQGLTQSETSTSPFGNLSSEEESSDGDLPEFTADIQENNDSFSIVFEKSPSFGEPKPAVEEDSASKKPPLSVTAASMSSSSSGCNDALEWDENHKGDLRERSKSECERESQNEAYLYIVMQLCQKQSLKDWLRDCTIERTRTKSLQLFEEICHGVEYVHAQGLIHRDLKPSNIFFSSDGAVKIGDFGLVTGQQDIEPARARAEGGEDGLVFRPLNPPPICHQHTDQVGTELYMSPEQVDKKSYNHKVDIYSLGLILFELLVPFSTQMERAQVLSHLRKGRFPGHFLKEKEFPLVKSMLEHDPDTRPEASGVLQFICESKEGKESPKSVSTDIIEES